MEKMLIMALLLLCCRNAHAQENTDCPTTQDKVQTEAAIYSSTYRPEEADQLYGFLSGRIHSNNKAVLIGEQHWMTAIQEWVTGFVLHLNEDRHYPNLVLEYPYSNTAFINEYINSAPGSREELLEAVKSSLNSREKITFLKTIQAWNNSRPDKKIRILCSDFEQDYGVPVVRILIPYFRAYGDTVFFNRIVEVQDLDSTAIAHADELLQKIPDDFQFKAFPFIDKQYVENVWTNVKSSYQAHLSIRELGEEKGFPAFSAIRKKQITQNLTDKNIFGKYIDAEKSIFWGGADHMKDEQIADRDAPVYEGPFLANRFKNRTFHISIATMGYRIPAEFYGRDIQTELSSYDGLVAAYKDCFPEPEEDKFLLLNEPNSLTKWVLNNLQQNGRSMMVMEGKRNKSLKPLVKAEKIGKDYLAFDILVFLEGSPLFSIGD